jgi:hypothetical protein
MRLVAAAIGGALVGVMGAALYLEGGKRAADRRLAEAEKTIAVCAAEKDARGRDVGEAVEASNPRAAASAQTDGERAYAEANRNLAENIRELNRRLASIDEKKTQLQAELEKAQAQLTAQQGGKPARNEFDLSREDWANLAKDGTVKFRTPCFRAPSWQPSPESLAKLALPPEDAPLLKEAYRKSNDRLWATLKPLCAAAIGSAEVAEKIGPETCVHLIVDLNKQKDREGSSEAMRLVGEVRAGLKPPPGATRARCSSRSMR